MPRKYTKRTSTISSPRTNNNPVAMSLDTLNYLWNQNMNFLRSHITSSGSGTRRRGVAKMTSGRRGRLQTISSRTTTKAA